MTCLKVVGNTKVTVFNSKEEFKKKEKITFGRGPGSVRGL